MARVFVSHSSQDDRLAVEVHAWLDAAGHDVFLDRDPDGGIVGGNEWEQRLHERLRAADAVVCLVTAAYVRSPWCAGEVAVARSRGARLIPVLAEPGVTHPLLPTVHPVTWNGDAESARAQLVAALRRVDATGGAGLPDDTSPFPGLRPFDTDQHRVFFGRHAEVNELAGLLRSPAGRAAAAVLLVVGPSGCGKSSLVRAGLLPVLADEPGWWTLPPILPGTDPIGALVRELAAAARAVGIEWTPGMVRRRLAEGGLSEVAGELLHAAPAPRRTRLLMVIDQFEELLTQTPVADRAAFAELLRPALGGPVRVVGALRPEFLEQLLASPELASLPTGTFTVRPLLRDALPRVIEGPADVAGFGIDDGLVARLVADTAGGEALPLLAYTLAQLAEGVGRGGRLSTARYQQLGGVRGTLTRQADAALDEAVAAGGRSRRAVIRELLRLVTVDEHGRPTRWRVPRADLPDVVLTELEPFLERRLLTTDERGTEIEVAHEAFLSAWAPLAESIQANSAAIRAGRHVEQAAAEWVEQGRPAGRLWERGQLAAALADTAALGPDGRNRWADGPRRRWWRRGVGVPPDGQRVELSPPALEFLRVSARRDGFTRLRATLVLASLLVLALVAGGVAYVQLGVAEERQRVATARQLITQADSTLAANPRTALRFGVAAHRLHPTGETRSALTRLVNGTRYLGSLTGHTGPVLSVAFAPDGRTLASAGDDGSVIVWDVSDRARPRRLGDPLTGHTGWVRSVAFAPDGRTLASAGDDGSVIVWDVSDRARPRRLGDPLTGHTGWVRSVAFAPDGRALASAGDDGSVIVWDVSDRARPRRLGDPLTGHTGWVRSVAFAPDGRALASAGDDGSVIVWDVSDRARPQRLGDPLTGHTGWVRSVAFAPDGRALASTGDDGSVIVWDVSDRARPQRLGDPLTGHTGWVRSVAFAPDGRALASAGDDGSVIVWDVSDRARPQRLGDPLTGHTGWVRSVAFAPDGRALASAGDDGSVIVWDVSDRARPQRLGDPLTGHTGWVRSVAFAPDGRALASAGDDGSVIVWDVSDRARPQRLGDPLTGHTGPVRSVAFAPDGRTLASAGDDRSVIVWDLSQMIELRDNSPEWACAIPGGSFEPDEWARYIPDLPYEDSCANP